MVAVRRFAVAAVFLLAISAAHAATLTCDGSLSDCQSKVTASSNGDTVSIPAGTFHWAGQLLIDNRQITLSGAGYSYTHSSVAGAGSTVIYDDNATPTGMIKWILYNGNPHRITGIEFRRGTSSNLPTIIQYNGALRIDHCKFSGYGAQWEIETWNSDGVIDHCAFDDHGKASNGISIYMHRDNHGVNTYGGVLGDYAGHDPPAFGGNQFQFIETCTYVGSDHEDYANSSLTDGFNGARFVVRYCDLTRGRIENHGNEGPHRGTRAEEVYRNTFHNVGSPDGYRLVNMRSGTCVVHDNTVYGPRWKISLVNYNAYWPNGNPFGAGDGVWPANVNDPANPYYSGTVDTYTAGAAEGDMDTVTVAGSPWTPGQWVSSVIRSDRGFPTTPTDSSWFPRPWFAVILGNTENTITYRRSGPGTVIGLSHLTFVPGDTFKINKVIYIFDQCGRGQETLITRDTDGITPIFHGPGGLPDQINEISYEWNNQLGDAPSDHFQPEVYCIRPNEHWKNETEMPSSAEYDYPHPRVTGEPEPTPTVTPRNGFFFAQ